MTFINANIKDIVLRVGQMAVQHSLEEWPFAERPEVRTDYIIEHMKLLVGLLVRFAEQPCEPVKYPADWWQAVKERFAPAWALRHWPVAYTVWEPSVIYPDIALPDLAHYIHIRKLDHL